MSRKTRSFRPVVGEVLEDRSVPSRFGFGGFALGGFSGFGNRFGGSSGRLTGSLPQQDAQQVSQAFRMFQQTYNQDVRSILLPSGTTNPSNNRAAFDQAIGTALGTLNSSIDSTIKNLPASTSLATTIQGELLGTGPNTLQTLLAAVPTPSNINFRSLRTFTNEGSIYINQTAATVTQQVGSSQAPTGSITQQTTQQVLGQVQGDFQAFSQTYFNDVQTILLPSGTTDPSSNRAAFDQAVGSALSTLNTNIDSALGSLPSSLTGSLTTTVQNDLLSSATNTGNNLQSELTGLQTPTGTRGFSLWVFQGGSNLTIRLAQGQVTSAIVGAINQYNASLSG